mmetsp:Transcript_2135/g.7623  ORF Transcript_2135/g.7623 Transcript_2135/m.7623 type:complete len:362 (-) Transcript_2135:29-1114(-)
MRKWESCSPSQKEQSGRSSFPTPHQSWATPHHRLAMAITKHFSKSQLDTLTVLNITFSTISLLGSTFILLSYFLFKDLRKLSFKLVLWLSFSDALSGMSTLIGSPADGSAICYIQAYITQFFAIASFAWTTCIAFTLYFTVIMHRADVADYYYHFHAYVWGLSFVLVPIPQIFDDYGDSGYWCWIRNNTLSGKLLRLVCFYVPLWAAIVFNGVTYFRVVRQLNLTLRLVPRSGIQASEFKAVTRLGLYPLILIACWLFPTVNRVQNFIKPDNPLFVLYCLSVVTSCMQGLCNSMAYGLNITVQKNWRELLARWGIVRRAYVISPGDIEGVSMVAIGAVGPPGVARVSSGLGGGLEGEEDGI